MPRPGKELAGGRFSAGASNQISLMKWIYGIQPDEPEATASMPMLPKTALPGGFALVIGHFISEITDCTQQKPRVLIYKPETEVYGQTGFCPVLDMVIRGRYERNSEDSIIWKLK